MIKYSLHDNHLTPEEGDFMARVRSDRTATLDDMVQDCIDFGTTLNEPELREAARLYERSVRKRLKENQRVPLFNLGRFHCTISGRFTAADAPFDPTQHRINVLFSVDGDLEQDVQSDGATNENAPRPAPLPLGFLDMTSDTNGILTPGGMAELKGELLRFRKSNADEGIFFINQATNDETKAENLTVGVNRPVHLLFLIPAGLAPGDYKIEVRARPHGVNDLREGKFGKTVTVS